MEHTLLDPIPSPAYSRADFRPDFVWGVSTAAYQTEGAWNQDGKGPSIWDAFTQTRGKVHGNQNGNTATDFYHRYAQDLDLMQAMGIRHFRWSPAWSRVLPQGIGAVNHKGLDFYERLTDACLERGITPWLTLYHWDLPLALEQKGGWTNRDILSWLEEYATIILKTLGDRVKNWMVLNEPMVFTGAGYFLGVHAPGKRGFANFLPACHHATLAMGHGGRLVRDLVPDAQVGTTFSCSWVEPYSQKERDVLAAEKVDALLNRLYVNPIAGLGYPLEKLKALQPIEKYFRNGDEERMPFSFDFWGIQNYTREVVRYSLFTPYLRATLVKPSKRGVASTEMGWEVYPPCIYHIIKQFASYKQAPKLYVTENGAAFPDHLVQGQVVDTRRTAYLQEHIGQVLKAQQEGIDLRGYFVWTFTDNFEWAEGFRTRFGLVHIDYANQQRTIKQSGQWYARFLTEN